MDETQYRYWQYFQFPGRSKWVEKIWSEAFGDQYPVGLDHYGFVTKHDLEVFKSWLNLEPGSTLLDIGCGRGGPGLKIAEQLDLKLIGIDPVKEAVEQAQAFQSHFNLTYPATFQVGEFYDLPVPNASADAVIAVDSLWTVPNKPAGLNIVKLKMKPGAKCMFTFWDYKGQDAVRLLEFSGLKCIHHEETPNGNSYQEKVYDGILQYEQELREEMGAAANMLINEAKITKPTLKMSVRRIYVFELEG